MVVCSILGDAGFMSPAVGPALDQLLVPQHSPRFRNSTVLLRSPPSKQSDVTKQILSREVKRAPRKQRGWGPLSVRVCWDPKYQN